MDWTDIRIKLWKENIQQVISDAQKDPIPKYLHKKITNESIRKGYSYDSILNMIRSNEMYASFFAKDPLKQNIAEKIQFEKLKTRFQDIIKLPHTGPNAFYFSNGEITNVRAKSDTKSFDFRSNNKFFYAKYTNEGGGAQDNQFHDLKIFLENSKKYVSTHENDYEFIAVVDGNYYSDTKFAELLDLSCDRVFVIRSHE